MRQSYSRSGITAAGLAREIRRYARNRLTAQSLAVHADLADLGIPQQAENAHFC